MDAKTMRVVFVVFAAVSLICAYAWADHQTNDRGFVVLGFCLNSAASLLAAAFIKKDPS